MSDLLDFSPPGQLANDSLAGAKAYFYDAGTSTPRTVYSDSGETTPHPSPLVADADGLFAQTFVSGGAVKVVVTDADDGSLYTLDPCGKIAASGAAASAVSFSPTPEIVATNVQAAIEEVQEAVADGYRLSDITILTSGTAATYTTPSGARALRVTAVGAGGGGGGVDGQGAGTAGHGRAGAGGGVVVKFITSPAASYTYTIGAGGSGGAAGANNGSAGGDTTFTDGASLTLTASGGGLGGGHTASSGNNFAVGAVGGSASGGDVNMKGVDAGSFHVVGGVLAGFSASGFAPGFGGNASPSSTSGENGNDGVTVGSGGTGGVSINLATNYAGGDGGDGVIIVEVFY